jgi:hypothetical protein
MGDSAFITLCGRCFAESEDDNFWIYFCTFQGRVAALTRKNRGFAAFRAELLAVFGMGLRVVRYDVPV